VLVIKVTLKQLHCFGFREVLIVVKLALLLLLLLLACLVRAFCRTFILGALLRLRAFFTLIAKIFLALFWVLTPALAALRALFIIRCLLLIVLAVLVLDLWLLVALVTARRLLFFFGWLSWQLSILVRVPIARFRGVHVFPKGHTLRPLMLEAALKIGIIDLLQELLAFTLRLGAVIGK
jgi:hypothetical protein